MLTDLLISSKKKCSDWFTKLSDIHTSVFLYKYNLQDDVKKIEYIRVEIKSFINTYIDSLLVSIEDEHYGKKMYIPLELKERLARIKNEVKSTQHYCSDLINYTKTKSNAISGDREVDDTHIYNIWTTLNEILVELEQADPLSLELAAMGSGMNMTNKIVL